MGIEDPARHVGLHDLRRREGWPAHPGLYCCKTVLLYDARCANDLYAMLKDARAWVELVGADEQKPAKEGTVEAWGRSPKNPAGGWYGLKKGLRGRFAVYIPPLMEALGLAELEHKPRDNRMRAKLPPDPGGGGRRIVCVSLV